MSELNKVIDKLGAVIEDCMGDDYGYNKIDVADQRDMLLEVVIDAKDNLSKLKAGGSVVTIDAAIAPLESLRSVRVTLDWVEGGWLPSVEGIGGGACQRRDIGAYLGGVIAAFAEREIRSCKAETERIAGTERLMEDLKSEVVLSGSEGKREGESNSQSDWNKRIPVAHDEWIRLDWATRALPRYDEHKEEK